MLDTIEKTVEIMEYTQDPDRLKELNKQRIALSDEARCLIAVSLDTARAEYRAATSRMSRHLQRFTKPLEDWNR